MNTYILHGGATSEHSPDNDRFFREFSQSIDRPAVKILCCYWALEENFWNDKFQVDKSKIESLAEKSVTIDMVTNPEELESQIRECDVFYVAGGYINNIKSYNNYFINLEFYNKRRSHLGLEIRTLSHLAVCRI